MRYPKACKLWKALGKDPLRPALGNAVYVGRRLVATNAKILAAIRTEPEPTDDLSTPIPAEAFKAAVKAPTNVASIMTNGKIEVLTRTGTLAFERPKDQWSKWEVRNVRALLRDGLRQKRNAILRIRLNAKRLADLAEALGSRDGAVVLYIAPENLGRDGELASATITVEALDSEARGLGLIMPILQS